MIRPRSSPLVAVLLSLLLLWAQQGAFAHMIGHLGGAVSTVTFADQGDEGHGEALSLSHVCTTCVSLSALAGFAPPSVPLAFHAVAFTAQPLPVLRFARADAAVASYRARAPPVVL